MNKEFIIEKIEKHKLIAIIREVPRDKLVPLAEALYEGGVRLLEVTYSANGSVSDENTAASVSELARAFEGRMLIGSGTVLTPEQVRLTKMAGGEFIISPNSDRDVIAETVRLGMVSIPGALTPTEIVDAHKAGADFVKLFPITNLGSSYVKAVKAPLSHIKLLAVGGIDEKNMEEYLRAGICGFGVGSNITDKKMIANGDWQGITALAKMYTDALTKEF